MSFGFMVARDGETWHEGTRGIPMRVIRDVARMMDVSVVTYPAYEDTSVALERSKLAGMRRELMEKQIDHLEMQQRYLEPQVLGKPSETDYGRRISPPPRLVEKLHGIRRSTQPL